MMPLAFSCKYSFIPLTFKCKKYTFSTSNSVKMLHLLSGKKSTPKKKEFAVTPLGVD